LADLAEEALGQAVIAILGAGDVHVAFAGELRAHGGEGVIVGVEGFVEGGGEEAGFEALGAIDGLLGEGHALDGNHFLGVFGLVEGDEILLEVGDFLEVFDADDDEGGGGEAVFDGVLRGAGFALGSFGSSGLGGVGAVGGELLGRDGHGDPFAFRSSMEGGWSLKSSGGMWKRIKEIEIWKIGDSDRRGPAESHDWLAAPNNPQAQGVTTNR
jgi:hypothetical protein